MTAKQRHELRRRSFDETAGLYEKFRPGYPEALFDDIERLSGIRPGGRILEIGPGTGQATLPLARRGFSILGLELSAKMARRCRRNLRGFGRVEIVNAAFEKWQVEPEGFELVLAASAFHWIAAPVGFGRSARALVPGGQLCLIWNFREAPDTPLFNALREAYRKRGLGHADPRPPEERIEIQRRKIAGSGRFGPVRVMRYPWQEEYTADEYLGLQRTMSDHAVMDRAVRRGLFRDIRRVIAEHGGRLVRPMVATLFLAPKRGV